MILLDTHVLVWALQDEPQLGPQARAVIERAEAGGLLVAAITPWEIALLAERGGLVLGRETGAWLEAALALPALRLAPLEPAIAVDSVRLPGTFHADPADRMIIATARHLGIPLMTADRVLLAYAASGHMVAIDAGV